MSGPEQAGSGGLATADGWAWLLDPHREVVGFTGRDNELAALIAWCRDPQAGSARLVTGPGGVGKTRLAVELGHRLDKLGWTVRWLAGGWHPADLGDLTAGRTSLLIVDHADERTGLDRLLGTFAAAGDQAGRVLFLARSHDPWWNRLREARDSVSGPAVSGHQERLDLWPALGAGLPASQVMSLAARAFSRSAALRSALAGQGGAARSAPGRRPNRVGSGGAGPVGQGSPDRVGHRVLDLHAAALLTVLAGDQEAGTADPDTALAGLLDREQRWWIEAATVRGLAEADATGLPARLRHLLAAACLLDPASEYEALALAARLPGPPHSAELGWLREVLMPAPGEPRWLRRLEPDRLAGLFVTRELAASPALAAACLEGIDSGHLACVVRLLMRAYDEDPPALVALAGPLRTVEALIAGLKAPFADHMVVADALPWGATMFMATRASAFLYWRIAREQAAVATPAAQAYWLENAGSRLRVVGRPADGRSLLERAVVIRREIAASGRARDRAALAATIGNLAIACRRAKRADEALSLAEEYLAIGRDLAAADPVAFRRTLAQALAALAQAYEAVGRGAEAVQTGEEAVSALRAASDSLARSGLASALRQLGARYAERGRNAEALQVTEESVAICRDLAVARAADWQTDLLAALHALGQLHQRLGNDLRAAETAEESVTILRRLVVTQPSRLPSLADELGSAGVWYSQARQGEESVRLLTEAVAIRRDLVARNPYHGQPMAFELHALGLACLSTGRLDEAVQASEESVLSYLELTSLTESEAVRRQMAGALADLGRCYLRFRMLADAVAVTDEAVSIGRSLAAAKPGKYMSLLNDVYRAQSVVRRAAGEAQTGQGTRAAGQPARPARAQGQSRGRKR